MQYRQLALLKGNIYLKNAFGSEKISPELLNGGCFLNLYSQTRCLSKHDNYKTFVKFEISTIKLLKLHEDQSLDKITVPTNVKFPRDDNVTK